MREKAQEMAGRGLFQRREQKGPRPLGRSGRESGGTTGGQQDGAAAEGPKGQGVHGHRGLWLQNERAGDWPGWLWL